MIRYSLDPDTLAVDSFDTVSLGSEPGSLESDGLFCQPMMAMAPITAHTDPCDVCCQQQ